VRKRIRKNAEQNRVEEQEEEAKGLRLAQSLKNDYYLNRRRDTAGLQIAVKV